MYVATLVQRYEMGRTNIHLYPWVIALCGAAIGLCAIRSPLAAVIGSGAVGSLFILHVPAKSLFLAAVLLLALAVIPSARHSMAYLVLTVQATVAAISPRRLLARMVDGPRWTGMPTMVLATGGLCAMLVGHASWFVVVLTSLCIFYLGMRIARHWAMADAKLLVWGEEGIAAVTRDLLLGRVATGMLHDLAQPLNVISMANGNMGYIVERLQIGEEERGQLLGRIERVATHTQGAAAILNVFRWFGRDGSDDAAELTVRTALERAASATRSNVRHHGVALEIEGDGLDYTLPVRHGALEIMAVAALLCSFGSFVTADGRKKRGKVSLCAELTPAHLTVTVSCTDPDGNPMPGKILDHGTLWLVQQVAEEAEGEFEAREFDEDPAHFVIRLGRNDV